MYRILIVEDDLEINRLLADFLSEKGYKIISQYDGLHILDYLSEKEVDLILLDLMLPYRSGDIVLADIRKYSAVPVIIISAKETTQNKIDLLRLGADDYITKPFSLLELSARIKANIRRTTRYNQCQKETEALTPDLSDKEITYKSLSINPHTHQATLNNKPLVLTNKEFDILKLLASHPERVYTKEQIYTIIWNEPYFGEDNVINVHINRLRSKLESLSSDSYINTLWGIGYKMEAD